MTSTSQKHTVLSTATRLVASGAMLGSGLVLAGASVSGAAAPVAAVTPVVKTADVKVSKAAARKKVVAKRAAARKKALARKKNRMAIHRDKMNRLAKRNPHKAARLKLKQKGHSRAQFRCLNLLWERESNWRWYAANPTSSAYGIPQSLPGSKMASHGRDWRTNPFTQIRWGISYIEDRYGSPCNAWGHSQARGWY